MSDIEIYNAKPIDAPILAHIHVQGWRDGYAGLISQNYLDALDINQRISQWEKWLAPKSTAWIAKYNDKPSSIISFGNPVNPIPCEILTRQKPAEIKLLYTLADNYRKGCGEALFRHALSTLSAEGYDCVFLWVLKDNIKGCNFYNKMGGTPLYKDNRTTTIADQNLLEIAYYWQL